MSERPQRRESPYRPLTAPAALALWSLLLWSGSANAFENDSPAAQRLSKLGQEIAADYADVTHISVATLKADYADAVLVDVRAAAEYKRSHLPGAVHAPTARQVDALLARFPDRDLVFYCTVGVRSSIAVRELVGRADTAQEKLGVRVANLQGSIFAWANQGEPLVNNTGPTREVHPFNAWWGFRYLDSDRPVARPPVLDTTERRNPE